ncbi:MAG: hypothetical protein ABI670_17880 [Chloroflexota bacterium]
MVLERRHIGYVTVESGRLVLVDPIFLKYWRAGECVPDQEHPVNSYDEAWKLTSAAPWHGRMLGDAAIVLAPSGGDGHYPAFVTYDRDSRCAKLEVVFSIGATQPWDMPVWYRRNEGDEYVSLHDDTPPAE